MKHIDEWLDEYGRSHRNPTNKLIHWICVPLIVLSLVGLLWSLPFPAVDFLPPLMANWAVQVVILALAYYFVVSPPLALGMLLALLVVLALTTWMDRFPTPLWVISIAIFAAAWIGQFIGHRIEGRKPSFFVDLQFLLIGPLWLLAFVYRRLGIRY
jgi:uncharacterized membrane protein YGL010W